MSSKIQSYDAIFTIEVKKLGYNNCDKYSKSKSHHNDQEAEKKFVTKWFIQFYNKQVTVIYDHHCDKNVKRPRIHRIPIQQ